MSSKHDRYILAIDLGTSGPKVGVFTTEGQVIGYEFEPTRLSLLPNGGAEQDPDDWWNAIKNATRRLLGRGAVPADHITALCCTTQWSGTVAVDETGRHLMNAIIWMDSRGAKYIDKITGGSLAIEGYGIGKLLTWIRQTGGIPTHSGKDPIAHILFIRNELPEIYKSTFKFLEPKDYLNLRLAGKFAASFDSIALHWLTDNRNIAKIDYDAGLLKMSGVERAKLPNLKRAVDVLGTIKPDVARELGLGDAERVQVVMGTPDVHSAAIGAGTVRDYEAHLHLGTSSWLACHVPYKKTDLFHNMASLPAALPGKYLLTNEQESAGACLDFLRDNLLYPDDELRSRSAPPDILQTLDHIAERAPAGSGRLVFAPWLNGERTPVDDSLLRGGWFNLSLATTRAQLIRAVYEGVAYNSRWLLGYVEQFTGRRYDAINAMGGGAKADVWCQIHADVLDRPIRQVKNPVQTNLRGAAFLAGVALGYLTVDDIPSRVEIARTYQPNPDNRKIYDELFTEFVNIYKSNQKIFARLNR
ncbi:MAG: FGGY-family carbohydrate kinase [Chloroflexota bacterium]|nr:FGGY-family carbohydrate kinase [Chloroflexota bacterium]